MTKKTQQKQDGAQAANTALPKEVYRVTALSGTEATRQGLLQEWLLTQYRAGANA